MAGIENKIVFGQGFKLQPSGASDIAQMQHLSTDVSTVNHTGNPEGVVSANPSSISHDPVSGDVYLKQSGTGNTGWKQITVAGVAIQTINGNSGSVTGTTVTLKTPTATTDGTANFSGSVATMTLNFTLGTNLGLGTNALRSALGINNTVYGANSTTASFSGNANAFFGLGIAQATSPGDNNTGCGTSCLHSCGGSSHSAFGFGALGNITGGSFCIGIGNNAGINYTGSESSNILVGSTGVLGESNVTRIGQQGSGDQQQNKFFAAGISGATVANQTQTLLDPSTGQLGQGAPLISFQAQLSTTQSNVTGDGTPYTIINDLLNYSIGGGYSTVTGLFTAPVSGLYEFDSIICLGDIDGSHTGLSCLFVLNSTPGDGGAISQLNPSAVHFLGTYFFNGSIIKYMNAGDTMGVLLDVVNGTKTVDVNGINTYPTQLTAFSGKIINI